MWPVAALVGLMSCAGSSQSVRRDCLGGDRSSCEQLANQHQYPNDLERWLLWTTATCETGSGLACWRAGLHTETTGDIAAAGAMHEQGCVLGLDAACLSLGYLAATGSLDEAQLTEEGRALAEEYGARWGDLRPPIWADESQDDAPGVFESGHLRDELRAHDWKLATCYERGLALRPDLSGRVEVQFVVGAVGTITEVEIREHTLADSQVRDCITRSFFGLAVSPPTGGHATVRIPYVFAPGD